MRLVERASLEPEVTERLEEVFNPAQGVDRIT